MNVKEFSDPGPTNIFRYPRYLLRMTELELLERERRATERRIRQAKFPVVKTMDSFDFLAIPSLNKTLVLELARCEFLARRENVLLLGNSGTGETHIALALGLAACQRGHRVRFTTTAALVSELIEARDDEKLLRFQKQIASYELLIVDELGFVPLSKTGAELLFEMLSQRYERGSTLVTSNLPFQEWTEVPRLGTADRRLAGPAHPPRSHPGDERRQLPPQAEPPQTDAIRRTLNSPPPNTPRGRRASSATLQRPFSPHTQQLETATTGLLLLRP
jgi:DNA replication protein DnaC